MKKIHVLVGLALAGAFTAAQAIPVDFGGYARGGYGVNTKGGRQTCFSIKGANNNETHYRLGNECDYTLELNLNATLAKNTDGSEWHVNFMLKNWRSWNGALTSDGAAWGNQGPTVDFAQAYAYGQNIPMLGNGTIWAGRRYYNRVQLGINDHFLMNDDGDGVGIDNISLGSSGAKLNVGIMSGELNGPSSANSFMQKYIVSVTDIPTFAGSKLKVHAKVESQSKADTITYNANGTTTATETANRKGGYEVLFFHETPNVLNGTLAAGIRFSKHLGNLGNGGSGDNANGLGKSTLLFVQQSGSFGKTAYDVIGEFKQTKYDNNNGKDKAFSLGARLDTPISGPLRGIAEVGYDTTKRSGVTNGRTYNFTHMTLAAAFSSGAEAWSRPTVRLYYTYGKWNSAVREDAAWGWNGNNGTTGATASVWGNKTSGSAVGAQWEAWW